MVEFGEQLKKAREAKGMTQQTLAEHLYVTRQAVSRWECGDRYPDLIMARKLAAFLEVSLDDLLSTEELEKVAERNQIIEKPFMKYVLLILYAYISLAFLITAADIITRFSISPMNNTAYSTIQLLVVDSLGLLIQSIVFIYGFIMALKGNLTPRKTGMIMAVYFVFLCLTSGRMPNVGLGYIGLKWNTVIEDLLLIIPSLLGAVSAYQYFCKAKNEPVWYWLLTIVSCWEILLIVPITHAYIRAAAEIGIYLLVIYQAYIMRQKRKVIIIR